MSVEEVCEGLGLHQLTGKRDWRISSCNATTGEGLHEAIDWLNMTISTPTSRPEFGRLLEEKREEQASHEIGVTYELERLRKKEIEEKLKLGLVPKAPPIFKTNGEPLTLTQEQQKTFVCSPVTLLDEDELREEEYANDPTVNEELARMLMEKVKFDEDEEVEGEELEKEKSKMEMEQDRERSDSIVSTTSESSSSSSSPSSAPQSPASLSSASSSLGSESQSVSHLAVTRTHTPELRSTQQLVREKLVNTFAKSYLRFASIQSTTTPLLASHLIPTVETFLRKKHFFSMKKTPHPIEDQSASIHNGWIKRRLEFSYYS